MRHTHNPPTVLLKTPQHCHNVPTARCRTRCANAKLLHLFWACSKKKPAAMCSWQLHGVFTALLMTAQWAPRWYAISFNALGQGFNKNNLHFQHSVRHKTTNCCCYWPQVMTLPLLFKCMSLDRGLSDILLKQVKFELQYKCTCRSIFIIIWHEIIISKTQLKTLWCTLLIFSSLIDSTVAYSAQSKVYQRG